ncbi:MAG TPA: ABC transporter ATP-binding protein [Longimicrobium sp.]|nr:ABC transporter ATP-binding protein [Longimicrobium sp.]
MSGGLRAFAADLARMMPRRLATAVALTLVVTAAEAASVLILLQLLAIVGIQVPSGSVGGLGGAVRGVLAKVGVEPTLAAVLLLYVATVSFQALVQRAQSQVSLRVELEVSLILRRRLYSAIAGARWLYFTRIRSSDLLQALTGECDRAGHAASYLLSMVVHSLVGLVYLLLALRISPAASGVAMACGGILLLALRRQNRVARAAGEGLSAATAEVTAAASEHLQSMKVVKSYGAEARNVAHFGRMAEDTLRMHVRAGQAYADARALFTAGSVALLGLVTWISMEWIGLAGSTALLLIFTFSRLVPRLSNLQNLFQYVQHDLPAYANVLRRTAALEAEREAIAPEAPGVHALREGVRFEGVTFGYLEGRDAVHGLEMEIEARRTTAVVGPSGAGKTTVADLVMGLALPREGRVVVDGRALEEGWLRGWREGIGYVAQETLLFHDTVLANLRWARPGATEEEVWEALRSAAADAFVRALPQGLETVVGDRGVRLSGGERQRLALARALLRRPALLILDEATSALDTENERRIRDAIGALQGKTTILLITHRLSSVRDADVIHVMEAGRVVESGDWGTLMARGGRFRELWRSQEAGEPAESPAPAD